MILADKIIDLRKKNGWSQEELADRLEVSRQAVSKWESAQSVPDMNKILKLSAIFGVSTDYLLKDEIETAELSVPEIFEESGDTGARPVSMQEAVDFLNFREAASSRVSFGVMLCILSPVLLILLAGAVETGVLDFAQSKAEAFGLLAIFILVGVAVALFVLTAIQNRFEYMEKEAIDTEYGVDGMARDRREKYRNTFTVQLTGGIVLCVMSVIPIFIAVTMFGDEENFAEVVATACVLVLVAAGVFMIIRSSMRWGSLQMLLEEGDYTRARKEEEKRNAPIAAIYWGLAVAGYLAYSFVTRRWDISWIIWPVAGVLYGALAGVMQIVRRRA